MTIFYGSLIHPINWGHTNCKQPTPVCSPPCWKQGIVCCSAGRWEVYWDMTSCVLAPFSWLCSAHSEGRTQEQRHTWRGGQGGIARIALATGTRSWGMSPALTAAPSKQPCLGRTAKGWDAPKSGISSIVSAGVLLQAESCIHNLLPTNRVPIATACNTRDSEVRISGITYIRRWQLSFASRAAQGVLSGLTATVNGLQCRQHWSGDCHVERHTHTYVYTCLHNKWHQAILIATHANYTII